MKTRVWLGLALITLLVVTLACSVSIGNIGFRSVRGSGNIVSEERALNDFNSVELSGIGQLTIENGDEQGLRIEAEDNLIEYIETEVRGGTLIISISERTNLQPTEPINYYLTITELVGITVSGAGNVAAPEIEADRFSVSISGAGGVEIENLVANRLDVDISGLGDLTINGGEVNEQWIEISGSGNYDAREVASLEADINLSGLGNATVWVTEFLNVDISGAGSVNYVGTPRISSDVSGLGRLKKIGD